MTLSIPLADLLVQREELERKILDAEAEIERKIQEVKAEYLIRFLQYPPELVDAILSDPATLESYYIAYERFKTLGISLDSQTPSGAYSREIPLSFTKDDIHFRAPRTHSTALSTEVGTTIEALGVTTSQQPTVIPSLPPSSADTTFLAGGNVANDLLSREGAEGSDDTRGAPSGIPSIQDAYIVNIITLNPSIKQEISAFFQTGLDALENTGVSTWQQRIDTLITGWNRGHPNQRLYRYVSGKSEGKSAGSIWKETYGIVDVESFQQVLGVRCPSWFQKRGTPRTRSNQLKGNVGSPVPIPVFPASSSQVPTPPGGVSSPAGIPASTDLKRGVSSLPSDIRGIGKLTDIEAQEAIVRDFIVIFNTLFPVVLEKYKKEKSVSWSGDGFQGLIFQDNAILSEQGGNATRGKYIKITIGIISEDQKPYWEALSSKVGRDILSRSFATIRNSYPGLSQAMLNDATGTMIEGIQHNEPVLRLMTGSALSIYFYLPTREMISQKKDWPQADGDREGEKRNTDQSTHLGLNASLEGYLEWYYDKVLAKGKGILKDAFTNIDTVLGGKTVDQAKGTIELSARLGEKSKNFVAQRSALHNFVQLNDFIQSHPESSLLLKRVDGSQPIRIIFVDPSHPGTTLEMNPY